jgi:hypothetical protein
MPRKFSKTTKGGIAPAFRLFPPFCQKSFPVHLSSASVFAIAASELFTYDESFQRRPIAVESDSPC